MSQAPIRYTGRKLLYAIFLTTVTNYLSGQCNAIGPFVSILFVNELTLTLVSARTWVVAIAR